VRGLDEVGSSKADDGQESGDCGRRGAGGDGLGLLLLRSGAGWQTLSLLIGSGAAGTLIVCRLATVDTLSTMRSGVLGLGCVGVDGNTASGGRWVVGVVRRRVHSSSIVRRLPGDGVSDGLGHTLAGLSWVRIDISLSLGDAVGRVGRQRLMRLSGLSWVWLWLGVGLGLMRLRLDRLSSLDGADGSVDRNSLGGDVTNRAVGDRGRALGDGVSLGGVDSARGVLSRLDGGAVAVGVDGMSVDGGEASSVCCRVAGGDHFGRHRAGRWCRIHNGLLAVVSVGNGCRSNNDDSRSSHIG